MAASRKYLESLLAQTSTSTTSNGEDSQIEEGGVELHSRRVSLTPESMEARMSAVSGASNNEDESGSVNRHSENGSRKRVSICSQRDDEDILPVEDSPPRKTARLEDRVDQCPSFGHKESHLSAKVAVADSKSQLNHDLDDNRKQANSWTRNDDQGTQENKQLHVASPSKPRATKLQLVDLPNEKQAASEANSNDPQERESEVSVQAAVAAASTDDAGMSNSQAAIFWQQRLLATSQSQHLKPPIAQVVEEVQAKGSESSSEQSLEVEDCAKRPGVVQQSEADRSQAALQALLSRLRAPQPPPPQAAAPSLSPRQTEEAKAPSLSPPVAKKDSGGDVTPKKKIQVPVAIVVHSLLSRVQELEEALSGRDAQIGMLNARIGEQNQEIESLKSVRRSEEDVNALENLVSTRLQLARAEQTLEQVQTALTDIRRRTLSSDRGSARAAGSHEVEREQRRQHIKSPTIEENLRDSLRELRYEADRKAEAIRPTMARSSAPQASNSETRPRLKHAVNESNMEDTSARNWASIASKKRVAAPQTIDLDPAAPDEVASFSIDDRSKSKNNDAFLRQKDSDHGNTFAKFRPSASAKTAEYTQQDQRPEPSVDVARRPGYPQQGQVVVNLTSETQGDRKMLHPNSRDIPPTDERMPQMINETMARDMLIMQLKRFYGPGAEHKAAQHPNTLRPAYIQHGASHPGQQRRLSSFESQIRASRASGLFVGDDCRAQEVFLARRPSVGADAMSASQRVSECRQRPVEFSNRVQPSQNVFFVPPPSDAAHSIRLAGENNNDPNKLDVLYRLALSYNAASHESNEAGSGKSATKRVESVGNNGSAAKQDDSQVDKPVSKAEADDDGQEKAGTSSKRRCPKVSSIIDSEHLRKYDVLFGRGRITYVHPGNRWFRKMVKEHQHRYQTTANRATKRAITMFIIGQVEAHGGRFLRNDGNEDDESAWGPVTADVAYEKVSHALRIRSKNKYEMKSIKGVVAPQMPDFDETPRMPKLYDELEGAEDGSASEASAPRKAAPQTLNPEKPHYQVEATSVTSQTVGGKPSANDFVDLSNDSKPAAGQPVAALGHEPVVVAGNLMLKTVQASSGGSGSSQAPVDDVVDDDTGGVPEKKKIKPGSEDVLIGSHDIHPRSNALRELLREARKDFQRATTPTGRIEVVDRIVDHVEQHGGRFLRLQTVERDDGSKVASWETVSRGVVYEKVRQALRPPPPPPEEETTATIMKVKEEPS